MRPALSVYIAASSEPEERKRAKRNAFALQSLGDNVTVTSSWWTHIDDRGQANGADFTYEEQFAYSYCDLAELDAANWIWVLMPPLELTSSGAFWEFGYAFRAGKHILISGPGLHRSIFTSKAHIRCATDEDALNFFKKIV